MAIMDTQYSVLLFSFLCLIAIKLNVVECFSTGPPAAACTTLSPNPTPHGGPPQTTPVPYEVNISALADPNGGYSYEPGVTYMLSASGSNGNSMLFRGVFLQGRLVADDATPAGTFNVSDPLTSLSVCSPPNIGVVHNSNVDKTSITTMWTAPPAGSGPLRIGFAVVMIRTVYWADQRTPLIAERGMVATSEQPTTQLPTTPPLPPVTQPPVSGGFGGDPHFSIMLLTNQMLCYSVQGKDGYIFNLISNKQMQMNALFVADSKRKEVTWIGNLGMVIKNARYKNSNKITITFDAQKKMIEVGSDLTLRAARIKKLTIEKGKLTISESRRKFNCSCFPIQVELMDIGLNFSVHFVRNNHLDMKWDSVRSQPENSHGIIGQFLRRGVDIDETRRLLLLPNMGPVPVSRKPIWHFMEREKKEDRLCWVAGNPGYQGKRLIEGHYMDYVVDNLLFDQSKY